MVVVVYGGGCSTLYISFGIFDLVAKMYECFQYKESIDTNQDNHHTNITIHFQEKKKFNN